MIDRFPHLQRFAVIVAALALSTCTATAQRVDHPDDSLYSQTWGVSVKAIGAALPIYSMADGPVKMRDYLVKNTSTHSETITRVASECDCVTPSVPAVGIDGKPQHLPCVLGAGESIRVRVAVHIDHLEPGTLEKTIEILGDGAAPGGVVGAFYVRARIKSPIDFTICRIDGMSRSGSDPIGNGQQPWSIDAGSIPIVSGRTTPHGTRRFAIAMVVDNRLLPPGDRRKTLDLTSTDPLVKVSRGASEVKSGRTVLSFLAAVEDDSPRPSFSVRLYVTPRITTSKRDATLERWLKNSRVALRGSECVVTGSVVGSVRAIPEAVTLGLYPRTGQPQSDRLDPLDPAGADVELRGRNLNGLRIEADSRLVSVSLTRDVLRVQVAPYLIRTYRAGGEIPRKARLASTSPSTIGDIATGQASMLYTNVRIFAGKEPPVTVPVTIMIQPVQSSR